MFRWLCSSLIHIRVVTTMSQSQGQAHSQLLIVICFHSMRKPNHEDGQLDRQAGGCKVFGKYDARMPNNRHKLGGKHISIYIQTKLVVTVRQLVNTIRRSREYLEQKPLSISFRQSFDRQQDLDVLSLGWIALRSSQNQSRFSFRMLLLLFLILCIVSTFFALCVSSSSIGKSGIRGLRTIRVGNTLSGVLLCDYSSFIFFIFLLRNIKV